MNFTYSQSSGEFAANDIDEDFVTRCASGHGEGLNNPAMERVIGIGPIPRGSYFIGRAGDHIRLGEEVMPLTPFSSNDMFGRDDFYIHGAEIGTTIMEPGDSSDGCILMERDKRETLASLVALQTCILEITA